MKYVTVPICKIMWIGCRQCTLALQKETFSKFSFIWVFNCSTLNPVHENKSACVLPLLSFLKAGFYFVPM